MRPNPFFTAAVIATALAIGLGLVGASWELLEQRRFWAEHVVPFGADPFVINWPAMRDYGATIAGQAAVLTIPVALVQAYGHHGWRRLAIALGIVAGVAWTVARYRTEGQLDARDAWGAGTTAAVGALAILTLHATAQWIRRGFAPTSPAPEDHAR